MPLFCAPRSRQILTPHLVARAPFLSEPKASHYSSQSNDLWGRSPPLFGCKSPTGVGGVRCEWNQPETFHKQRFSTVQTVTSWSPHPCCNLFRPVFTKQQCYSG